MCGLGLRVFRTRPRVPDGHSCAERISLSPRLAQDNRTTDRESSAHASVGDTMLPHNPRTLRGVSSPEARPARGLLVAAIEVRGEDAAEGALATSVVDTAPATPSFFFCITPSVKPPAEGYSIETRPFDLHLRRHRHPLTTVLSTASPIAPQCYNRAHKGF